MGEHVHELLHVAAATLFVSAGVSALIDYRNLRERGVLNYSIMCLAAAAYAAHVAISHMLPKSGAFWIPWTLAGLVVTFSATLFYLRAIGDFLNLESRLLRFACLVQGVLIGAVSCDLAVYGLFQKSFLFSPVPRQAVAAHQFELGEAAYTLLPPTEILAGLFMASFVCGVLVLLVRLVRTQSRDPLLYLGLCSTMLLIVNETLVAMSVYEGMYLLAFSKAFEMIRIRRDIRLRARRAIERRLRQAEKMESIGRVAGGLAHDFNNILMAIGGSVDLAAEATSPDAPAHADLETAREGVERGRQLVRQLLDVARSKETEREPVDVGTFLAETSKLLEKLLPRKTRLEVKIGPELGRVLISRGQLTQVLINLVVNASDSMPSGGTIDILAQDESIQERRVQWPSDRQSWVRIAVVDEGEGIPNEVIDHIFEPFFTTKSARGGSGLGLASLYSIVESVGGTVEVQSQSGRGTRFDVVLPRLDD